MGEPRAGRGCEHVTITRMNLYSRRQFRDVPGVLCGADIRGRLGFPELIDYKSVLGQLVEHRGFQSTAKAENKTELEEFWELHTLRKGQ